MKKFLLIIFLSLFLIYINTFAFEENHKYVFWKLITKEFFIENNTVSSDLVEGLNWNTFYLTHTYFLDKKIEKLNLNVLKKLKDKVWYNPWEVIVFYWDNNYFNLDNILKKYIWNNKVIWWYWNTSSIYEPSYKVKCINDKFYLESYVFNDWKNKINLENTNKKFSKQEKEFIVKNIKQEFKTCKNFKTKFWLVDNFYKNHKDFEKLFSKYYSFISKKYWEKIEKLSLKRKLEILSKIDNLRIKITSKSLEKNKLIKINILLDVLIKILVE